MSKKKYPRTFWLLPEDIARLEKLSKMLNTPPRKVVAAALSLLESNELAKVQNMTNVIPPLRIKLEPSHNGEEMKCWPQQFHPNEGDDVMVINMRPGGDIVQGLVCDDLQEDSNES